VVDELTELAALYHRDKLAQTLEYPLEYVSGRDGKIQRESFDYFPEHHYEEGFEQMRGTVDDEKLDEWIERALGGDVVRGTHGGLWKDNVPKIVEKIMDSTRRHEVRISIEPETTHHGYDYTVEWEYIDFDRNEMEWKPVNEID
jgi:hypothetical protein